MRDTNFRTLITEEEKNRILGLHKSYNRRINPIYEQTLTSDDWLKQAFTKALGYYGDEYDPNSQIKTVPGGKIYLVDDRYEMAPSYYTPACNADRSNQPCWSLDTMKLTGQYVDANKYMLEKDEAQYDGPMAAAGEAISPAWYTDNGEVFSVVVHNGVAYGRPNFEGFAQALGLPPAPIDPTRRNGVPEGYKGANQSYTQDMTQQGQETTQQDSGGGGEEEDKKELEVVKNDMQYSKGDIRRLERNLNKLKRYRKRKANRMTSTIQAQYDALIKDLEAKVGQV
jgi:hypothetical protein